MLLIYNLFGGMLIKLKNIIVDNGEEVGFFLKFVKILFIGIFESIVLCK